MGFCFITRKHLYKLIQESNVQIQQSQNILERTIPYLKNTSTVYTVYTAGI